MSFDLSQFRQVFFDESFEGLELMESGLLSLRDGAADAELINEIFRAIHSIKGGSGTFGFAPVGAVAHTLETLLDEIRTGARATNGDLIGLLLRSVDHVRHLLVSIYEADDDGPDVTIDPAILEELAAVLGNPPPGASGDGAGGATTANAHAEWEIHFAPHPELLRTGNEPARLLRELAELGELRATIDVTAVPPFAELEPEECHLSWHLSLRGLCSEAQISDVFAWVEDECELSITALGPEPAEASCPSDSPAVASATEAALEPEDTRVPSPSPGGVNRRNAGRDNGSIRVSIEKVDELINMVGELVITQSMLSQFRTADLDRERLLDGLAQLERNTRELQENVMQARMLPISFCFSRFPRLVYDLSRQLGKQVALEVTGESTELDKTVLERIGDPLVHLVRNSLDHGLESPEQRRAVGKPETGTISLNAYHAGGNIVIEVADDGRGIDLDRVIAKATDVGLIASGEVVSKERATELIFEPGFSTAGAVSDVSGRGVGMDVVRQNIKGFGGSVEIDTQPGVGTKFTIRLPLTLAIVDGQLVRVGDAVYVISLLSIVESVQGHASRVNSIGGASELYSFRDEYVPVARLNRVFDVPGDAQRIVDGLLVLVEADGECVALLVDELLGQQQVVVKSLEANFRNVSGLAGATILGDGTVALILDVPGLVRTQRLAQVEPNPLEAA